jgi:YtkA-like protein
MSVHKSAVAPFPSAMLRVFALTSLVLFAGGCMASAQAPAGLDYSRTRASEGGVYRATIRTQGDSIPKGKLQSWTLHLETAAGAPVDTAQITIDGGMPQHGHGLPTKPQVTRVLGNGDHLVEGMKFNMGGWWIVKFRVSSAAGRDSLVFNLSL